MDWIEKIFGMSPDNGDGSTEIMLVTVSCLVLVAIIMAVPKFREQVVRRFGDMVGRSR